MASNIQLLEQSEQYNLLIETQQKNCSEHLESMFGDRTDIVIENVIKILGSIQSRMNVGKNPLELAPGKEGALVDLVAGVKALRDAGPGADSTALQSYIERVQSQKPGLQPEQAEIAAIKTAGQRSKTGQQIQQAFTDFTAAIQSGDHKRIQELKNEFNKLYMFYQQLNNKRSQRPQPTSMH